MGAVSLYGLLLALPFLLRAERLGRMHLRHYGSRSSGMQLCPSYPYPVANTSSLLAKMQPFLDAVGDKMAQALSGSPGGAVVSVVYNDSIIWTKGFGLINMSEPDRGPPTENTGFRIGSITKVFTALMMLMLRDSGKLRSLDDDITNYLPEFSVINPYQTRRGITFRQLSSHMSGLPRNPPCPGLFDTGCNLSYDKIYDNLSKMRLSVPPGSQPGYSNLGFGLLGRVLGKIGGSAWEDLVEEMVIEPLAMSNSGNTFTAETLKSLAVGYYLDGTIANLIDIGWDSPAGQMYSSTHDLAQLLQLIFRPEKPYDGKTQILDGESIREWMQPAYNYADGTGFSYPWELEPVGNYTLRTKDGVMNGYNAEFQFAHEIKTGFVFLHSCDGCPSHSVVTALGQDIIIQASTVLEQLQPGPALPPNPTDYTGTYKAGELSAKVELGSRYGHTSLLLLTSEDNTILDWRGNQIFQLSLHGGPVDCYDLARGHVGDWVYFGTNGTSVTDFTIPGLAFGVIYQHQET